MSQVVVVGAGAAGIVASITAAQNGADVVLLEKTDRVGTKILISGGGKCNITHDGPIEDVLRAFRPNEARFLRPSFYRYPPQEIVELLTTRGLEVYTRPNGRIFPVHQTAKDVVQILRDVLDEAGVDLRLNTPVDGITVEGGAFQLKCGKRSFGTRRLVLCVGGKSFPRTGTTGDGYPWVKSFGHTLVPIRAALAPVEIVTDRPVPKAGVALRDCVLKARANGKEVSRWQDDLLFTHRGVSGPTVLGITREVSEAMERSQVSLEVDLLPTQTFEGLTSLLSEQKSRHPNRLAKTLVEDFMPESTVALFLAGLSVDPTAKLQSIGKKDLNRIVAALKGWDLGQVKRVMMEQGEVVAGGVALEEVDPHTMQSHVCPGLFLCGEILDIAGPVGGYNLQAAWSTGFVAGESAATL